MNKMSHVYRRNGPNGQGDHKDSKKIGSVVTSSVVRQRLLNGQCQSSKCLPIGVR